MTTGSTDHAGVPRGTLARLFGVMLVSVGVLDSLLAWRGGGQPDDLHVLFVGAGGLIYLMGLMRAGRGPER